MTKSEKILEQARKILDYYNGRIIGGACSGTEIIRDGFRDAFYIYELILKTHRKKIIFKLLEILKYPIGECYNKGVNEFIKLLKQED